MRDSSPITKITRIMAGLLAVYLVVSALGSLTGETDAGGVLWAGWVLVAAAAIIAGLVIVNRRPLAGTVSLCVGAILAIGAYFWFPPLWLVSLLIVAGAMWSFRTSKPKAPAVAS